MKTAVNKNIIKLISIVACFAAMLIMSACDVAVDTDETDAEDVGTYIEDTIDEVIEAAQEIDEDAQSVLENIEDIVQAIEPTYTENDMVEFDPEESFSYCETVVCNYIPTDNKLSCKLSFKGGIPKSDDEFIYLFERFNYEDDDINMGKAPVAVETKDWEIEVLLDYKDRYLFSRFIPALLYDDKYVPLSYGQYITNPEALAANTSEYPNIESKKGILLDANTLNTDKLYDLEVRRVVYNVPLSYIIGESENPAYPTIDYEYNGKIYHFNGYQIAGFDSLFTYLTHNGFHSTIIVLNDWNKEYPEIIHPLARQKTRKSMYYAFNTEEEEGVRLLEATALFLAERYSNTGQGMVYDWVIANEINQQKIWNYMATEDIDYYTQSFEKAFRTFYNAIKSKYSNANVYFSVDHDWNNNDGNNRKFFNARDILYKFNDTALKGGNYDWGLSIHPYPTPLTRVRFWDGKYNKTEEARVVTPMNLSSLTDVIKKKEFYDSKGNIRDIAVTELGFTSRHGEQVHAAAFAYCYYIIENNDYISTFLMNRQTDDTEALKSGLALGIYNNDYSAKYIAEVFRNVDNEKGKDYLPEMLEILGADSLEEALSWAE